jgi:hypothetical protein
VQVPPARRRNRGGVSPRGKAKGWAWPVVCGVGRIHARTAVAGADELALGARLRHPALSGPSRQTLKVYHYTPSLRADHSILTTEVRNSCAGVGSGRNNCRAGKPVEAPPRIRNANQRCRTFEEREPFIHSFQPNIASGHLRATSDERASRAGSLECVGACLPTSRCPLFKLSFPRDIHNMAEEIRIIVPRLLIMKGARVFVPHLGNHAPQASAQLIREQSYKKPLSLHLALISLN